MKTYLNKKNFLLFCPKTHNFGGFHESLLWALKIKKYNKKKIIINLPIISVHSHYRTFIKEVMEKNNLQLFHKIIFFKKSFYQF